jgi:hypothetical protein
MRLPWTIASARPENWFRAIGRARSRRANAAAVRASYGSRRIQAAQRFSEQQIAFILHQAEEGGAVEEVRRTVVLHGARGDNRLAPIPVPERLTFAARGTPPGEATNVGQMYVLFAQAIREGQTLQPTFEIAVDPQRLIDTIRLAPEGRRQVTPG